MVAGLALSAATPTGWVGLWATKLLLAAQAPQAPQPPLEPSSALTVLYIEGNLSNLRLVERVVSRRAGVRLISAMRPQLGLDLAAEHHPDLLLLDLHLPDLDGEEVLRRLRADPHTPTCRWW